MHHIFSHSQNVGNECADHAAALRALGLICSHNLDSRWSRPSFNASAAVGGRNNLEKQLTSLREIRRMHTTVINTRTAR